MGKFSSAKMNGAQDIKFKNVYNSLIDLLETGYIVESMIDGHKIRVSIDPRNGILITSDGVKQFGLDSLTGKITLLGAVTQEYADHFDELLSALDDAAVKLGATYAGAAMSALSGFTSSAIMGGKEVVINMSAAAGGMSITVDGTQVGGIYLVDGTPMLIAGAIANATDATIWAKIGSLIEGETTHDGIIIYKKDGETVTPALGLLVDNDGGVSLGDDTWRRFDATKTEGTIVRDINGVARFVADTVGTRLYDAAGSLISAGGDELEALDIYSNGFSAKYKGQTTSFTWILNPDGTIANLITIDNITIPVGWHTGAM